MPPVHRTEGRIRNQRPGVRRDGEQCTYGIRLHLIPLPLSLDEVGLDLLAVLVHARPDITEHVHASDDADDLRFTDLHEQTRSVRQHLNDADDEAEDAP